MVQGLIFPIYKTGDTLNPSNYRGIAITSCLSKLFNSILNARFEKYIPKNELIRNEQIGFKAGCRTSGHIFKLKAIIDKYLNKSKKVYACYIDLRKAFDSVIHSALFLKLLRAKIGDIFLGLLKSLYSNLSFRVIVNSHSHSNAFPSNVGVFQGDNLSPNVFNLYIDGLIDDFYHSCSPVLLGQEHIRCLLYADELVLLSESQEGLQNCLNKTWEYCKIMIFNKGSRLSNVKFYIDEAELVIVRHYRNLGIMLSLSGSFTQALLDLTRRGQKAFFKLKNTFNNIPCSAPNCMHIFDHTVKPVLVYASEIVGLFNNNKTVGVNSNNDSHFISNLYSRNPLEKLNISMGKYVFGVNKRTTNLAIYGELGRYPLYIDTIISMIKYWVRLCKNTHHDPLLREAYEENLLMYGNNEPCWLICIHILLKHLNMNHMLTHPENFKSRHIYRIKKKIQNNYETFWKINLNKCEKLRTYRKFKFIFGYETYISDNRNISHRNILTRFLTSNHKLHIETGRYARPITPVENHICSNCNSKSVEDELHFLMYCPRFENHRRELFSNVLNYNAARLSAEDKFVWILSNEDPSCVRELAKCIHSCFQMAP